ncbi:putative Sec-independent protein translocase [Sulfuricella denitrificans skB26]|uniref:Sec-independent protein translocase protein TatB n=1 Tax=Sulfuricella denitrificans (strain DSM 22764 / NBRC 105220 / skB26) TaxID=1163617 RepID=S6AB89_SULDS|nr:Sec-independent protein translocase protein TatB [Sulfuricella denitrificans]BAN34443.1 putative Sec-independent protein translocase [Sulfuricella denitrificans skB26]
MFDFSFFELMVIGVVALIVIGPERMPKVARTAGLLFGRAQRYVSEVKADINNQLKLEELRKIEADLRAKASTAEHVIIEETRHVEQEFRGAAELATPADTPSQETEAAENPGMPQSLPSAEPPAVESAQLELGLDSARPHQAEASSK